jgi:hypothetical protein
VQSLTPDSFQFQVFDAALLNALRLSSSQKRAMENCLLNCLGLQPGDLRLKVFRATGKLARAMIALARNILSPSER